MTRPKAPKTPGTPGCLLSGLGDPRLGGCAPGLDLAGAPLAADPRHFACCGGTGVRFDEATELTRSCALGARLREARKLAALHARLHDQDSTAAFARLVSQPVRLTPVLDRLHALATGKATGRKGLAFLIEPPAAAPPRGGPFDRDSSSPGPGGGPRADVSFDRSSSSPGPGDARRADAPSGRDSSPPGPGGAPRAGAAAPGGTPRFGAPTPGFGASTRGGDAVAPGFGSLARGATTSPARPDHDSPRSRGASAAPAAAAKPPSLWTVGLAAAWRFGLRPHLVVLGGTAPGALVPRLAAEAPQLLLVGNVDGLWDVHVADQLDALIGYAYATMTPLYLELVNRPAAEPAGPAGAPGSTRKAFARKIGGLRSRSPLAWLSPACVAKLSEVTDGLGPLLAQAERERAAAAPAKSRGMPRLPWD